MRDGFWQALRAGETVAAAARVAGVSQAAGQQWVVQAGGVLPKKPISPPRPGRVSFQERSLIESWLQQGHSPAQIARLLRRPRCTISRELARCGGPQRYRALTAEGHAERARARPKPRKLATSAGLLAAVVEGLTHRHSPEQIAGRLRRDHPDDPELWVSHETIYQAIYVQPRGELSRQLKAAIRDGKVLRSGREHRRQHGRSPRRTNQIPHPVSISERPAEADDRAVPGHWEGDLILGSIGQSAIGTTVERASGFVILHHLVNDHTASTVAHAISRDLAGLPSTLKRTLTWDRGIEMAKHADITTATGIAVYFADPYSPWQRGSNENTNGLLRQYFPKGTDLSVHTPEHLAQVAAELNNRPRKRLAFATPAEHLQQLLSQHDVLR